MKDSKRSRPVSGVSRRRFIKGTAVGVAVAGFPAIVRSANDRKIVIRDPGGPFTPGFAAAYYEPFTKASGITAVGAPEAPRHRRIAPQMISSTDSVQVPCEQLGFRVAVMQSHAVC